MRLSRHPVLNLLALCAVTAAQHAIQLSGNGSISLLEDVRTQWAAFDVDPNQQISHLIDKVLKRQSGQCRTAGYVPCSNEPDFCCPAGYDCVTDGCCPSGQLPCGASKCYNPSTSVCCPSTGNSCPLGEDCVPGGCCTSGKIPCGSEKCYDPKTQKCCASSGTSFGCPIEKDCCTQGGATACLDSSTEKCCSSGGGCDKDYTCCDYECCGSSSTCGSDGYCTRRAVSTTTAPIATTPFATATPTDSTRRISFRYDPDRKVTAKDGKQYEAQNKAVLLNMCQGIRAYLGYSSQEITLTRTDSTSRANNRKAMCPPGYCAAGLKDYLQKFYPEGIPPEAQQAILMAKDMSCDEFPFAISAEGGDVSRGRRICIPGSENSWQGGTMSSYFKLDGIKVGEKFTVVIEGFNCDTMMPETSTRAQRRQTSNTTQVDGSFLYSGNNPTNPYEKLLTLPVGDLGAGIYSVDVSVTSGALDFSVLTYDGLTIPSTQASNGSITFSLDSPEDAVGVVGVTSNDNVQVSYTSRQIQNGTTRATSGKDGRGFTRGTAFLAVVATFVYCAVSVLG